jgi:hypothetical protein
MKNNTYVNEGGLKGRRHHYHLANVARIEVTTPDTMGLDGEAGYYRAITVTHEDGTHTRITFGADGAEPLKLQKWIDDCNDEDSLPAFTEGEIIIP